MPTQCKKKRQEKDIEKMKEEQSDPFDGAAGTNIVNSACACLGQ